MWQQFCKWLLYKRWGWTTEITEDHPDKYIICLAPHTSNWDFILGQLYSGARGMQSNFLMKKEWFFFPLGILFKRLGGIPVIRQKKTSMTDSMAEAAKAAKTFHLCITPEGTRSANPDLKVALKADSDTPYKTIRNIMSELQDINENRYYLITSLKTSEE